MKGMEQTLGCDPCLLMVGEGGLVQPARARPHSLLPSGAF